MLNADFTDEQKQYLAGFVAGAELARSAKGFATFASTLAAGGAGATAAGGDRNGKATAGPDAMFLAAQDRFLAAGKKLCPEEEAKRAKPPLDLWDEIRELTLRSVPLVATLPSALRFLQWMCATCTDQPLEVVQKLSPDDGIQLSVTVVEVNHDFFVRRLLPLLEQILTRLPGSVPRSSASAQSAASSSPPATPTSSSA